MLGAVPEPLPPQGPIATQPGTLDGAPLPAPPPKQITRLSLRDAAVHARLMRVMHMLDAPSALLSPGILLRLAADKLGGLFRRGGAGAGAGA
jgi:hypothetical protein